MAIVDKSVGQLAFKATFLVVAVVGLLNGGEVMAQYKTVMEPPLVTCEGGRSKFEQLHRHMDHKGVMHQQTVVFYLNDACAAANRGG